MGLFQDEASLLGVAVAVNEDSMPVMSLNTLPKLPSIPSSHAPPWRDRYGSTVTVASTPSMMSLYGDDGAGDLYAWPSLFEQVCGIGCVCCGCGCAYTLRRVQCAARYTPFAYTVGKSLLTHSKPSNLHTIGEWLY